MKTISLSGRPPVKLKSSKKQDQLEKQVKSPIQESSLLRDLGVRSFSREYSRLLKKINAEDFSGNQASYAMLRAQLAMLIQALPVVEKQLHQYKSERAAYALVSLSGHAREIAHDLRTFGDQSEMRDRIHNLVIRKLLGAMATKITQEVIATRRDLHVEFPGKVGRKIEKRLDRLQKSIIENVQGVDSDGLDMLTKILQVR